MSFGYRNPQSPCDESQVPSYSNPLSPQRDVNRLSGGVVPAANYESRGNLPRRFTMNALPTLSLSPAGQQRMQAAGGDYSSAVYNRRISTETQARAYENLLSLQRKLQSEIEKIPTETRREVDENRRHEENVAQLIASASEPASPPEYNSGFPSSFSRPQRYSAASLTSPPGINNRPNRSSTHLTSPSVGVVRPYASGTPNVVPSQSVPGSRRHSDDEEEDDFTHGNHSTVNRSAANPNRNSMPITGYGRKRHAADFSSGLGPVNTTSFLFDEDEEVPSALQSTSNATSPPNNKRTSLQLQHTPDGFPKLIRSDNGDLTSSALDLAFSSQGADTQQPVAEHSTASRHRISLPLTDLGHSVSIAPLNSILANADSKATAGSRRSVEVKLSSDNKRPSIMASPPGVLTNGMQKPTSSFSTNDIPTLKSMASSAQVTSPPHSTHISASVSPDQSNTGLLDHTSSTGSGHQSQDTSFTPKQSEDSDVFSQTQSSLQGGATPFGPSDSGSETHFQNYTHSNMAPYVQPGVYGNGYNNVHYITNGFNTLNMSNGYGSQGQWPNAMAMYPQGSYGANRFQEYLHGNAGAGANRWTGLTSQQKRQAQDEADATFNAITTEDLPNVVSSLCKDQNGCRYLQRKLDEPNNAQVIQIIFDEVKSRIVELMADPFGNYLCQKLLEKASNDQRTTLIRNAMPSVTTIATNQHGTRALQKMIEHIKTREQVNLIIEAMRYDVVLLVQDINGNHVIQKCLNHLSPADAQFIFEAVGESCVQVGTHRHGCCVLQRCIDHADGPQKGALVDRVIQSSMDLVQDPFGNYVVQYVIDLGEPSFTEPMTRSFFGHIVMLSKQKFSSNVVEKCIRCASPETRAALIRELNAPSELEKLLRDGYANYVVQTALDQSDEETKSKLIDNIRPMLPVIRNTPYGRRIQSKISDFDTLRNKGMPSVMFPTSDVISAPNGPINGSFDVHYTAPTGRGNRSGFVGPSPQYGNSAGFSGYTTPTGAGAGMNGAGNIISPTPQRHNQANNIFSNPPPSFFPNGHTFGSPGYSDMTRGGAPYNHF